MIGNNDDSSQTGIRTGCEGGAAVRRESHDQQPASRRFAPARSRATRRIGCCRGSVRTILQGARLRWRRPSQTARGLHRLRASIALPRCADRSGSRPPSCAPSCFRSAARAGRPRRRRSQSLREPVMESRRPRAVCPALLIWSAPWLPSTFRASKSCGSSLVAFFASLQRPGASALFKNASSVTGARPSNLLS